MRVVDTLEMERLAVGTLLASARGDLDAVARLIAPLEREELMGCLAYCARFAVSQAAQSGRNGKARHVQHVLGNLDGRNIFFFTAPDAA